MALFFKRFFKNEPLKINKLKLIFALVLKSSLLKKLDLLKPH